MTIKKLFIEAFLKNDIPTARWIIGRSRLNNNNIEFSQMCFTSHLRIIEHILANNKPNFYKIKTNGPLLCIEDPKIKQIIKKKLKNPEIIDILKSEIH